MSNLWERCDYRSAINTLVDCYEHEHKSQKREERQENPLLLWEAISLLEKAEIEVPQTIVRYLQSVAEKLLAIDTSAHKAKGGSEKVFNEIRHALGITDIRMFTGRPQLNLVVEVADAVREELNRSSWGQKVDAFAEVQKEYPWLSESTIKKYYEKIRALEKSLGGAD